MPTSVGLQQRPDDRWAKTQSAEHICWGVELILPCLCPIEALPPGDCMGEAVGKARPVLVFERAEYLRYARGALVHVGPPADWHRSSRQQTRQAVLDDDKPVMNA